MTTNMLSIVEEVKSLVEKNQSLVEENKELQSRVTELEELVAELTRERAWLPSQEEFYLHVTAEERQHEQWATLPSNDRYEISNLGRVFDLKRMRVCKVSNHGKGYAAVKILDKDIPSKDTPPDNVNRLVAEAFRGSVKGKKVYYRDKNKRNNKLSNLEIK
ncbi:hypothetical protein CN556_10280 [Bacillus wiedmannii]|uniref:NUMOD4 domain-containing protein n=1 Tax=Bacillus cereus group TaxID=86661 RepID=UPI000BEE7F41|nr:NUMOD4 domain-containing protein [Bacillus wiedmannii]PEC58562.1 hypothetical protein CON91_27145 [Bacillus wiedmannii]PEI39435.1 hypothetical protein CN644_01810 [Bacillus wiedmannii]PEN96790.1 hypothetical protein CN556_10280 [Bacillus wiedmannii]